MIDVADHLVPVWLASLGLSGKIDNIEVAGDVAYLAAGNDGVHLLDVSDPSSPQFLKTVATPGHVDGVHVVGDLLYVAEGTGLVTIDVSDPLAASVQTQYALAGFARDVKVVDGYATSRTRTKDCRWSTSRTRRTRAWWDPTTRAR